MQIGFQKEAHDAAELGPCSRNYADFSLAMAVNQFQRHRYRGNGNHVFVSVLPAPKSRAGSIPVVRELSEKWLDSMRIYVICGKFGDQNSPSLFIRS